MAILLVLFLPAVLVVISLVLVLNLGFWGVLPATIINTGYFAFLLAALKGMGNSNAVVPKINWARHGKDIAVFALVCLGVLSFIVLVRSNL